MWSGIVSVGLVMAIGTPGVLDAPLPGGLIAPARAGADLPDARTMAFATLVLFQLRNVFNARSDDQSAFSGLLRNPWLWGVVLLSLALHLVVVYVPPLQNTFQTVGLAPGDWMRCVLVASSVLRLRELSKFLRRVLSRGATARLQDGSQT